MPKDSAAPATLSVTLGQYSNAGAKPENQDFHGALIPEGSSLALKGIALAIADGISSSKVSREAAETAVKSLLTDYYATPDAWTVKTSATRVIAATNAWLHGQNTAIEDVNAGRVCTLSALILKGREGHILHVGDSRVSRLSGASLEPLTTDHRVTLSAEESYLGRAMGMGDRVDIDYRRVSLKEGDIFLLTTDGVHEFITAASLRDALGAPNLDAAARALADAAQVAGSQDNLTVQIVRIDRLPDTPADLDIDAPRLPVPPLPKSGDVIDGFRIERQIHATSRSHVFLATAPDGHRVALKIPATDTALDADYLRRFVLEEWIARRLRSSHVLRAAKAPDRRTALYVVTEFVEGVTLRQWMTDHPSPTLDQIRDITGQIAAGLRAFHRREMVHQDLRPENIMIDESGTAKIIDLGSTSVAGVEEAMPGMLGELPGTYQYTAPEYFSGDPISWRSDQYALGAIAYEMLTGRLPYGPKVARISNRRDQMRLSYAPARDDDNAVPGWMDEALRRATHPDPLRRYDALSEFVTDLSRPGATWSATRHVPLAERNPVRFWQSVAAILAVLCLILAAQLVG
ncbi:bifunctional protein-serine/threonine kinase/phosphatase [Salipiger sp. PrR002]|uniref:bifunctional protein-serine/threonine kinase/phosphatase n=1 Tax=Salipiger sp. PrR002 TaxID=2706489 RepID=UPI0013BB4881|nr:bifunctional protein-serine/threonine kinase/phosphatase [Salipiger sp. PrR002]NDW00180.1 bifunctional protein-serine/threonine kinase/phosphatase [Salipiger sp. PrR002]NDW56811.1 bifunctional protein-serine/threonine kinase/phosphatase [Salipiger sp. PrR004]